MSKQKEGLRTMDIADSDLLKPWIGPTVQTLEEYHERGKKCSGEIVE